jgi:hypothetical protein
LSVLSYTRVVLKQAGGQRKENTMKYLTPHVQSAGVASKLIQAKVDSGSDGSTSFKITALSTLLEAK